MSAVGETRQRSTARLAWRAASAPVRLLRVLLGFALLVLLLALGATAFLAWRLSQGPLDVAWLARRIESSAFPQDSPTRLRIGQASIAWQGWATGADQGLELRLRDVRVVEGSATPARVDQADLSLSLGRLLELQFAPRSVLVSGLRARAMRAEDGTLSLDLGTLTEGDSAGSEPVPSMAQTMAELRRPATQDRGRRGAPGLEHLTQLQHVRVRDAEVDLVDRALHATVRGRVESLDLQRQGGGGVKGEAEGQVTLGQATASLALKADLAPGGGTHFEATLAPLQASAVAQSNPALASLGALDAALQARGTLDLSPRLEPLAAALQASAGGGSFSFGGGTATFERVVLDASATWNGGLRPEHIALERLQVVLPSPSGAWSTTVGATGQVARRSGQVTGSFDLTLDHVLFADIGALLPEAWGGNVRPWIVRNVTAGTARDGAFRVTIAAPENDLAALELTQASGTLQGDDVTINWLRPVPPVEHAQASMRVVGPDAIDIGVASATQGALALHDGLVRFTGLSQKDQDAAISLTVNGTVPDTLALLKHPRLRLLDRHPLPIKSSAGTIAAKLSVELPMRKELDMDQVKIGSQGRLTGLRLAGLVAGRDLDNGDIQFEASQDGLKASGPASVANIAGTIGVEMDFRSGPPNQVQQRATISGNANARQLAAAGIDPGGLLTSGVAGINAAYAAQRDGTAKVDVKADLKDAGVALVGWRKPPGPPADASATILLRRDKLAGISALQAQGPGMRIVGKAEMVGDRPLLLRFDQLVLGPTQASGEVRFPDKPGDAIRARLSGPVLDLSTEFSSKPTNKPPKRDPNERDTPWIADIRFDRVLLAKERSIGSVTAHAENDGRRLKLLQANSTGPERVQAVIAPQGTGRRVSLRAADGGALLRVLDVTDTVHGGSLAVEGQYDDRVADPPLSGTLDLSNFAVHDAVAVGKLLQMVTVYGIVDAMRGQGVQFTRLLMPFRFASDVLDIGESRAFSSSLGLTAHGRVDLGRKAVDVRGTIVPAYALNSALGRIPLVGRLFSPERGGGLVAVDYSVTGSLADPNVKVNPLSALTPGFLRGLFKIFD